MVLLNKYNRGDLIRFIGRNGNIAQVCHSIGERHCMVAMIPDLRKCIVHDSEFGLENLEEKTNVEAKS